MLSIATLLGVVVLLAIPPVQLSGMTAGSPAGIAIALGIWAIPTLLSVVVLYHVSTGPQRLVSYLIGVLGILTLGIIALNVSAVLTTDGAFTYGGSGAFVGPVIALFTASLLGVVVLLDTGVNRLTVLSSE
ncbi:hypothetical protein C453_11971 [Haloferax elongans ATCC BAA-1513]|uniref:Uncharacterized protein n=1 Tax=Haloferax elongans ATCC BAA-1513 TaxID=1230453 RepID=M0HJQ8_HALEO|nr:hypothetical protein C453_11971 [Haloferax elongans ATCC BAA-1513]